MSWVRFARARQRRLLVQHFLLVHLTLLLLNEGLICLRRELLEHIRRVPLDVIETNQVHLP